MPSTYQERHASRLSAIVRQLFSGKDAATTLEDFTQRFYAKHPVAEMEKMESGHAAAVANLAWEFVQERNPHAPKLRVFQSTPEQGLNGRLIVQALNDDMPFLVDSLTNELTRLGFLIHETIHPVLLVERDGKGRLKGFSGTQKESLIHFELSALPEGMSESALESALSAVLAHVRAAVVDWKAISTRAAEIAGEINGMGAQGDISEGRDFLNWLVAKNFVFLGYADITLPEGKPRALLGICAVDPGLAAIAPANALIDVSKADQKSLVHRPVLMDVVTVQQRDAKGSVTGEHRLFGLFTSLVYYQPADAIPFVRRKIEAVLARAGFDPVSHDGKALKAILEFLPRDEMFQIAEDELFDTALGILALESRPGVRLFARRDARGRFVSCLVYIPREHFSTPLRLQIQISVERAYHARLENYYTQVTDAPLARLHLVFRADPKDMPTVDIAAIEAEIARFTHAWPDQLKEALYARFGEASAERYWRLFATAFPEAYVARYDIGSTVHDIAKMDEAMQAGTIALELYQRKDEESRFLHLKIYNPLEEIALSDILPVLENMGFRVIEEYPFEITPVLESGGRVWVRDIRLGLPESETFVFSAAKPVIEEALARVWSKELENDRFNALVLIAGLDWRQVTMLRAYAKYLKQIGFAYAHATLSATLAQYPYITHLLADYFGARFNPAQSEREAREQELTEALNAQLAQVATLADDKILRRYMELMRATLRTNFYQRGEEGDLRPVLSFKFDSASVPDLPLPRPYAEIFVYSTRVEGIHLRGGKVARGGLRWSDRPEDFRTEILGLMKAQMVKNAVIVPVGSKGGFVLKRPPSPSNREAFQEEGIACYKLYLSGLLDLTDNIVAGSIKPPRNVVRHDGDDPYLVVAADKGTASFSDIANSVSRAYGFWLDDAFASGGSAGYDHKKMAITARGGWVSVTRHFREMGVDIDTTSFTATGIGDMSGDVFGNGMLLSKTMKLVAAFNHMHIFIDPTPDPQQSFEERSRLFALPRSSWTDYDTNLISQGGGIYERSAKQITLSAEAQAALGLTQSTFTPDELVRAILLAPVDLLWNGGIGTYVKAEDETHEQVGDRANNAVRVNGKELRCKVVGEGGNLGFTQKGRIEYARIGGRLNTDAIDNSAGVDCSDHEVNIKIAYARPLSEGRLSMEARNKELVEMTEEVARLVLRDNILQTQALTIAELQGTSLLGSQTRLIRRLEAEGLLNRAIEYLPSDRALEEMQTTGRALTRPEIAVLLAYSKIALYRDILASSLPDEDYFAGDLLRYFPKTMTLNWKADLMSHPLKREIIATVVTNSLVNRAGITFFADIAEDTGLSVRDIAAAYTLTRDLYGMRAVWSEIERATDVPAATQVAMIATTTRLVEHGTRWMLRNNPLPIGMDAVLAQFGHGMEDFLRDAGGMHSAHTQSVYMHTRDGLLSQGVSAHLSESIALLGLMASAFDIIRFAEQSHLPLVDAGKRYFDTGALFRLGWLREQAGKLRPSSHWERLSIQALVQDAYEEQTRLGTRILQTPELAASDAATRYFRLIDELEKREQLDTAMLTVALRRLKEV